ncbi:hypothetical protein PPACK8108_LOCUS25108 [Phakopsora pachyrhizi]|uniref:Uncharacterized protein n=1 Tax=Phakopsora pachyrhizi TaxID=170000 RepID=A0AAV0BT30_PHAPC|nr:hypothetical protein PPACK8108_LOCUS25108 [Phakopsora pachyrhizi]
MPRPRRNSLPAPFSPISSLPLNIGPPPSPHSGLSPALSDFSTDSLPPVDLARGTNWSVVPPPLGKVPWCNPTIKACGYEHPIARTPTEDMDSGASSKGLLGPQVALLVSVRLEVEDTQEDLRNEEGVHERNTRSPSVERIRVPTRPTDPTTQPPPQHQPPILTPSVSYSNPVNPPGHRPEIEAGPSSLDRLSPGLGLVLWTFDHPSEDVLKFENDKERAWRLLVNTHRLSGAHVGKIVKGASNNRGREMYGLLTHAITQLSDWYETLEVENYEGFEWDDSHGKRKAEDSP